MTIAQIQQAVFNQARKQFENDRRNANRKTPEINTQTRLDELNFDSLDRVELFMRIERELKINHHALDNAIEQIDSDSATLGNIINYIETVYIKKQNPIIASKKLQEFAHKR